MIIAHRGSHETFQENTLEAYKHAIELGVDGIEVDVRVTKDDDLILFHDRHLRQDKVRNLTYKQISDVVDYHVPFAYEALELSSDIIWNLELKTIWALDPILKLIEEYKTNVIVTSFWHNVVEEVSNAFDEVECGLLVSHRPFEIIDFNWFKRKNIDIIVWDFEFMDESLLKRSKNEGITNFTYTIKTKEELEEAKQLGFDGFITDYLERG